MNLENIPPYPGKPSPLVHYPVGSIFTWYAADDKFHAKLSRFLPPAGWEYAGKMVKLKPKTAFNPHPTNLKYVLYLRKV